MKCQNIRELLALYAGSDLKPRKAHQVEQHIADCGSCRLELQQLIISRDMIRNIANEDMPSISDNFADTVIAEASLSSPDRYHSIWAVWPRIAAAACLLGMVTSLWFLVTRDMGHYRAQRLSAQRELIQVLVSRDPSIVDADRLAGLSVRGPYRLDEWEPSGAAGLFAILHKPDPENRPDEFSVDFLGEASRIDYRGDTWRRQRINRLTARAGNKNNIYIAEYLMPGKSPKQRRAALNTLITSMNPYYN